jgi:hypothetical protein
LWLDLVFDFFILLVIFDHHLGHLSFFLLDKVEELLVVFIIGHVLGRLLLFLHSTFLVLEDFLLYMNKSLPGLLLHAILLLLSSGFAFLAEEGLLGDFIERRAEAIDVETLVAFVTDYEFDVVVIEVLLTDLACHVLQSLVPLLSCDVSWP